MTVTSNKGKEDPAYATFLGQKFLCVHQSLNNFFFLLISCGIKIIEITLKSKKCFDVTYV